MHAGNTAGAEEDLNAVIRVQPDSAPAHFALAHVKALQGSENSARQELTETVQRNPRYLSARLMLARVYIAGGEPKTALDLIDETPGQKSLALAVERNWALLGLEKLTEASAGIAGVLRVSRAPEVLEQDGFLKMKLRDFAGVRRDAEEILQQAPEHVRAIRLLADSYAAEKQLPKAVERVRQIAAMRPKSAPLQQALGQVLIAAGEPQTARKAFELAESDDSKFSLPKLALAQLDLADKQFEAAHRRASAVLSTEPRNIQALRILARIELQAGARQEAAESYRTIVGIDSSDVVSLGNLAVLLAEQDNPDALKFAQQAAGLGPDNVEVQDTLAWIYFRKGSYREAIDYLKQAIAKDPRPRLEYHLAVSYLKAGDRTAGQQMLASALNKDPKLVRTEMGWK